MKSIDDFLTEVSNWNNKKVIKSLIEIPAYNSNDSKLYRDVNLFNIEPILGFWKESLLKKKIELEHPDTIGLNTVAYSSVKIGMANYILFLDCNNANPWLLCQCENAFDVIITQNNTYTKDGFEIGQITIHLHKLKDPKYKSKLKERPISSNPFVLLGQLRPFHFFYDQYKYFLNLCSGESTVNVYYDKPFYKTSTAIKNSVELNDTDKRIGFFPTAIGGNYCQTNDSRAAGFNHQMINTVREDINCSSSNISRRKQSSNVELSFWYGITGKKRRLVNQVDVLYRIVELLAKKYKSINIYIDGITAADGMSTTDKDDQVVLEKIVKRIGPLANIHSMIGKDYKYKILKAKSMDFFISNSGSGCIVPMMFSDLPGVLHGNTSLETFPDVKKENVCHIDNAHVYDVPDPSITGSLANQYTSYIISWEHIYNQVLCSVFNSEELIPEPTLTDNYIQESIARNIKEINKFEVIAEMSKSSNSVELLRDLAFLFEDEKDYSTALALISKALQIRPNGPVLKRKLSFYKSKLGAT